MESHRRLLSGAGHPVRVIAGRGDCELIPELDSRHPEVEALTERLAAGADVSGEFESLSRRIAESLSGALREVDLVLVHNVLTMHFNLPLAQALSRSGKALLAWTHDLAWSNPRYAAFQRHEFPYNLIQRPFPGVRYTAISERVKGQLEETLEVTGEVVPNGIDRLGLLRIRPATRDLLAPTGVLDADPLVLVPFRVTGRKRLETVISTAALLATGYPGLKVVVTGPLGPHSRGNLDYWARLSELRDRLGVADRVVFLHELGPPHPVDEEMVAELYQLASAVLLTSESEGFGLPVLEAGLARVPVVCSELDVFREVAADLAWTFPVDAGPPAVAAVLAEALGTRQAQLQSRVRRRYDWQHVLPMIEKEIALAIR